MKKKCMYFDANFIELHFAEGFADNKYWFR